MGCIVYALYVCVVCVGSYEVYIHRVVYVLDACLYGGEREVCVCVGWYMCMYIGYYSDGGGSTCGVIDIL